MWGNHGLAQANHNLRLKESIQTSFLLKTKRKYEEKGVKVLRLVLDFERRVDDST